MKIGRLFSEDPGLDEVFLASLQFIHSVSHFNMRWREKLTIYGFYTSHHVINLLKQIRMTRGYLVSLHLSTLASTLILICHLIRTI